MLKLNCTSSPLTAVKAQTLVLFAYQDNKKPVCDVKGAGCDGSLALMASAEDDGRFTGALKEVVFFRQAQRDGFDHTLIIGLGDKKKVNDETLRLVTATAVKTLSREKVTSAVIDLRSLHGVAKSAEGAGRAMAEGALLGSYRYDEVKSKKKEDIEKKELRELHFALLDKIALKKFGSGVDVGIALSEATNFARDLGNAPSNYLTPKLFASKVAKVIKGLPIKFKALDKQEITALKMGCFLGVNKGSHEEPRFLILEYSGAKKADKPLILVGKGITFDTGGISIKPSAAMEEMKFDMCGGAAVVGAILAIAKLKLKLNVVALVPATENMPGGSAIKPGDVLTARSGKTVEVNNTDAEGRLVLADALAYACDHYSPLAIVDAATLTGACVVALGNVFTGFFCKDDEFTERIRQAAAGSGERLWQLPLVDDYVDDMKGTYADLSNMGGAKGGGASQGAAFLSQFVEEAIPWAHFDIAGSAWHTGNRYTYNPDKGATGAAVRLFTQLAINFAI